jgi:3,4-dihydroxy 2-butanone 4-phosphate synthase/GTP cyclohydrolase II
VKGELGADDAVLCRMHRGSLFGDVFSGSLGDGGRMLNLAIDAIEREGRGLVVYLPPSLDFGAELSRDVAPESNARPEVSHTRPHAGTLREYGLGAQVLRHLGVRRIRLLTNTPRRIAALHGYGLDLVDTVALG